jgi:hypothetical protein
MKRNDVVTLPADGGHWLPYGRINRKVGDKFEVIYCDRNVRLHDPSELEVIIYKGRWDRHFIAGEWFEYWMKMPTLRKLKQMASGYNPKVWKKNR